MTRDLPTIADDFVLPLPGAAAGLRNDKSPETKDLDALDVSQTTTASESDAVSALYEEPILPAGAEVYSTVLRMGSPCIRVWIHYDVCDNVLCQVSGRKRVMMWRPERAVQLGIDARSSSSKYGCGEEFMVRYGVKSRIPECDWHQ